MHHWCNNHRRTRNTCGKVVRPYRPMTPLSATLLRQNHLKCVFEVRRKHRGREEGGIIPNLDMGMSYSLVLFRFAFLLFSICSHHSASDLTIPISVAYISSLIITGFLEGAANVKKRHETAGL